MHKPTRTLKHIHTYAADPEWINQWCRGLTQGLSPSFVSLSLCFPLPLFTKINQVCIWRSLLPLPVTSGMKEWVREREGGSKRRGNSHKRRQEYRHSWGVNCNNPSLISRPSTNQVQNAWRQIWPWNLHIHIMHTHTNSTKSSETAG